MPGCAKRYTRPYDLARHLDAAHHAALSSPNPSSSPSSSDSSASSSPSSSAAASSDTDTGLDARILAAGVPPNQVARVRQLLGRRNACAICGAAFSRRDALVRHLDEQGHRIVEPPAPVRGFRWALVPARGDTSPPDVFLASCDDAPAAPLLRDADDFPFSDPKREAPLVFPGMPSLEDWEALITSWAQELSA